MKGTGHRTKRYEVFFRYVFTSAHPYSYVEDDPTDIAIPVTTLSHVTHNREADEIKCDDGFVFRPQRRTGKAYKWDGSPMGESFQDDFVSPDDKEIELDCKKQVYNYVSDRKSLMPQGYYSWWGIKASKGLTKKLQPPPEYLNNPPSSPYGNREFSGNLYALLQCYQESRKIGRRKPDIFLLVGGTLRYTHEICCVVIVCTKEDKDSNALSDYKPFSVRSVSSSNPDPVFDPNGLTGDDGKVNFSRQCEPKFYPKFLEKRSSWANLSFTFYFSDAKKLKCGQNDIQEDEICHTSCIKKKKDPTLDRGSKWVCPNNLN